MSRERDARTESQLYTVIWLKSGWFHILNDDSVDYRYWTWSVFLLLLRTKGKREGGRVRWHRIEVAFHHRIMPTVCPSSFVHLGCVLPRNSADTAIIAVTYGNRIRISVETHRRSIRAITAASTPNYEHSIENWCSNYVLQHCNVRRVIRCEMLNALPVLFQYCVFSTGGFLHEETDYLCSQLAYEWNSHCTILRDHYSKLWLIRSSLYVAASEDPVEGGCIGKVLTV